MSRFSSAVRVSSVFVCVILSAVMAHAQFRTSIQGVVTDSTGAVVPGATLTLTNPATGETQVRTSSDEGVFNFNALAASAKFRLVAEKQGFQKKVIDNLSLVPDQPNAVNVELGVSASAETVTVNADAAPLLDTETASVSGVVSSNQVQHMPSFGRDVFQLIQLAPGVFGDGAQGSGGGGQSLPGTQGPGGTGGANGIFQTENGPQALAAGQQYENNSISIDGISTTSAVWGGTTIITPSEDSVESVKVLSNGYDAENGRFSGAQIEVTSKSGTNNFHGSAFFTAHRPGLDAYQSYNGTNTVQRDNSFFDQFGGAVGGPIWKNKIFGFFAWETVRSPKTQTTLSSEWFETSNIDGSTPAGPIAATYLGFPGNAVVAKGLDPHSTCTDAGLAEGPKCATIHDGSGNVLGIDVGSPLTSGVGTQDLTWVSSQTPGVGGGLDGVPDLANFITSNSSNYTKNQYNGRVDANVTTKDHLAFAIYWVPQTTNNLNGGRAYDVFHHTQKNNAFSAIWNRTFSPTLLNEFRVNAAGWRWNEVTANSQSPVGLPVGNIDGIGSITVQHFGPNVGSILNQWTYSYKDVATKIIGRHTIKFGGDITRLFYLQECAGCGVPSYNFFNLWDFLNDAPHFEGGAFNPTTGFPFTVRQDDRTDIWGFFAQDDLKLRPNLTLNLGLRYNYFGPLSSKEGNMFVATPGAGSDYMTGLTVHKGQAWNAQKGNFGPQIGFAWSPSRFQNKLVVRGGYGLNYNQEEIAISSGIVNNPGISVNPNFNMSTPISPNPGIVYAVASDPHCLTCYPSNPNVVSPFGANGLPTNSTTGVTIFPNTLPTMRVHHWSLDTQYDLGHNLVASLGYQGSRSRNLFFHSSPNAIPAALGYTLNPVITGGDNWAVNGYGNYNALLAEVKHNFSRQFSADAQFTWSKTLDTASSPYSSTLPPFNLPFYPYNPALNYGPSDYNVGKAFKLFGMWQPVFFHGNNAWIEKIAGGWSLSGILNWHAGFPWTPVIPVENGNLYCSDCGYGNLPATYLGGAGSSTSNDAFKTGSNFANGAQSYFGFPAYTAYNCAPDCSGNANPSLSLHRNSFKGPGYRDLDLTLTKGFGLPSLPGLGENARFEFRVDAYNIFNNLNFTPNSISNNIGCDPSIVTTPPCNAATASNPLFGKMQNALAARVVTLGARFSF